MRELHLGPEITAVTGAVWPGVNYFCTRRTGGVSAGPYASLNLGLHVDDNQAAVLQNRQLLGKYLPAPAVWLNQIHGTQIHWADSSNTAVVADADALITTEKNTPLAIMIADCMPVVISDTDASILAVAHAGWRGLAAGILQNTIAAMRVKCPQATQLQAWIGPCISAKEFEVGAEVFDTFAAQDKVLARYFVSSNKTTMVNGKARIHYYADLAAIARHILLQADVVQVEICGDCTYTDTRHYFSYRRDGQTGRQVTLAWLTDQVYPN